MRQVAVYAAVGAQAHHMQGLAVGLGVLNGLDVDRVFKKFAVLNLLRHLRQDLEHHAARAHVGVADLGVAHLPLGQAHVQPGGLEQGVRVLGEELIQVGGIGDIDGVPLEAGAMP